MAWRNNTALLRGRVTAGAVLSHISRGVPYYSVPMETRRLSGASDRVNLVIPEALLPSLPPPGGRARVEGELRSYNNRSGSGSKLVLYIYAQSLLPESEQAGEDLNEVSLRGVLCRDPVWRRTPMGREICDLMLAVNRRYGRADYLPCISWGAIAQQTAMLDVGAPLCLEGRIQSRTYAKTLPSGTCEERTAYEVSVMRPLSPEELSHDFF